MMRRLPVRISVSYKRQSLFDLSDGLLKDQPLGGALHFFLLKARELAGPHGHLRGQLGLRSGAVERRGCSDCGEWRDVTFNQIVYNHILYNNIK
jgi:hypothetical protein